MADPLDVGAGAQSPVRSRPLWGAWLVKPGVSLEASRGTLCPASPSVSVWCGVPVVCVVRGVWAVQKILRRTFSLSGVAPGSTKVGSRMVRVFRVGFCEVGGCLRLWTSL